MAAEKTQTSPKSGELTIGESFNFNLTHLDSADAPTPSIKFGRTDYARKLGSLRHATKNHYTSVLKSYKVNVDGKHSDDNHYIHQRREPLIIGAQFTKPGKVLVRGSQLYVFALLFSDTSIRTGIELRDDGLGYDEPRISEQAILAGVPNPAGSVVAQRSATLDEEHCSQPAKHWVIRVTTTTRERTGNWYLFVFAQDVNTALERRRLEDGVDGSVRVWIG